MNIADSRHNLLGLDLIKLLGLLDILLNSICNAVPRSPAQSAITEQTDDTIECFSPGITNDHGRCTQAEAVTLVFLLKWPIPYAVLLVLDRELKHLEESKVINSLIYPFCIKNADSWIRMCADFSTALEDYQYILPVPDVISNMLNGDTCFAKLDLTEAYL